MASGVAGPAGKARCALGPVVSQTFNLDTGHHLAPVGIASIPITRSGVIQ